MRYSQMFCPTLREVPSEAEVVSHQLLLRAGYIRKSSSGVYSYLPLANRVLQKIMNIIREEMNRAGGQEVMMPIIQPRELWERSGRWAVYGEEMFRLKDRHQREFALGPTHEEIFTATVDAEVHSYRGLPLLLYQIANKYRDEIRPRFGVLRGREFIMKDLYSFDLDYEGLDVSYNKMYDAYCRVYDRLGLEYRVVDADSGAIGGNASQEFVVLADSGESVIVYCTSCDYAADVEKAECPKPDGIGSNVDLKDLTKVPTPGQKTIAELQGFLGVDASQCIKTLTYLADGELVAVLVRGDRELNEIKLTNHLRAGELSMAPEELVREKFGAGFGSLGPVGLNLKCLADLEVEAMLNAVCGGNEDDTHYINVNPGRDFNPEQYIDLRNAVGGDPCPVCGSPQEETRGIEAGQIFKLGTKYSETLQARYQDQNGNSQLIVMGCYGIGVSRTMAAAVEQNYDENGIIWPISIAPYHVIIVPVNVAKEDQIAAAEQIYTELQQAGLEVILDDRDERAGVKFKDADLIGIPFRITIGPKSLAENKVEFKGRRDVQNQLVPISELKDRLLALIKS